MESGRIKRNKQANSFAWNYCSAQISARVTEFSWKKNLQIKITEDFLRSKENAFSSYGMKHADRDEYRLSKTSLWYFYHQLIYHEMILILFNYCKVINYWIKLLNKQFSKHFKKQIVSKWSFIGMQRIMLSNYLWAREIRSNTHFIEMKECFQFRWAFVP